MFRALLIVIGVVCLVTFPAAPPARSVGKLSECTEAALDAAIVAGGTVAFACDGVIPVTATKLVPDGTTLVLDATGHDVTLDGGGTVQLFVVAPTATLHLHGLTLARGRALQGGAVRNQGTLRATDSAFIGHVSLDRGGAIGSFGPSANLHIENSRFEGNSGFGGGAVANGSFVGLRGNMKVARSTFINNHAEFGGAVLTGGDTAEIEGSVFHRNTSTGSGGAITNGLNLNVWRSTFNANEAGASGGAIDNGSDGVVRIYNSTFTSQMAVGGGGAIRSLGTAQVYGSEFWRNSSAAGGAVSSFGLPGAAPLLVVEHSRFKENVATSLGGAITASGSVVATLAFNHFEENAANRGGAIAAFPSLSVPHVELRHSVFHQNEATIDGGAILSAAPMLLSAVQVIQNAAHSGGGLSNLGNLTLEHVLLAQNDGGDCTSTGTIIDDGHNIVLDGSCGF